MIFDFTYIAIATSVFYAVDFNQPYPQLRMLKIKNGDDMGGTLYSESVA